MGVKQIVSTHKRRRKFKKIAYLAGLFTLKVSLFIEWHLRPNRVKPFYPYTTLDSRNDYVLVQTPFV